MYFLKQFVLKLYHIIDVIQCKLNLKKLSTSIIILFTICALGKYSHVFSKCPFILQLLIGTTCTSWRSHQKVPGIFFFHNYGIEKLLFLRVLFFWLILFLLFSLKNITFDTLSRFCTKASDNLFVFNISRIYFFS